MQCTSRALCNIVTLNCRSTRHSQATHRTCSNPVAEVVFACRSELRAVSGTAAARLRAETDWLELGRGAGLPVHVFRLGGAFGRPDGQSASTAACQQDCLVTSVSDEAHLGSSV